MSHCLRWLGARLLAKRFCYEVDMASKLVAADERRSKRATESCQSAFKFGSDAISMMFTFSVSGDMVYRPQPRLPIDKTWSRNSV